MNSLVSRIQSPGYRTSPGLQNTQCVAYYRNGKLHAHKFQITRKLPQGAV